jgi:simple sugar transport system permease protein
MKSGLIAFIKSCIGAAFGLCLGLLICKFAGESPIKVLKVLYQSSFGSGYDFGMTLFYTAPFILTGLAVAIPFRAGLFNIGAEGQLTMGALCVAASGVIAPHVSTTLVAVTFACVLAFIGGGIWGMIPGFLKAKRGSHEVITTILLNFIAAGVSAYFILYVLKDPASSQAETVELPGIYHLKPYAIFNGAPMGDLIWVLVLLTVLFWLYLNRSRWGYELRSTGENERAAETFGISKNFSWMSSMFVAGGVAGLVGVVEVLGNSHRLKMGFSADYGFVGIAVALVARGNILGIIPSAFLFGVLQKGSGSLDLETDKVTRDLSYIIQGLIILGVASDGLWDWLKYVRRKPRAQ